MPRLAFDRDSMRREDANGYLHVQTSPISKAQVVPYYGKEVPGFAELGLDPDKIYQVYRPAEELEKSAATFNNLPIISVHKPISAAEFDSVKPLIIGSTGTDSVFNDPYLENSLVFYDGAFIEKIADKTQAELSACYRYTPIVRSGLFNGERYDIIMTDLIGNHVALVEEGRAGSDVVVADSQSIKPPKKMNEKLKKLIAIAMDGKTVKGRELAKKYLLALDGDMEAEKQEDALLAQLEEIQEEEKGKPDVPVSDADGSLLDALKALIAQYEGDAGAQDEEPDSDEDDEDEDKKKPFAQDAALRLVNAAIEKTKKEERARYQATEEVREITGSLNALAFDSASAVYAHALKQSGIDLSGIEPAAYRGMVKVLLANKPSLAQDSAPAKGLKETFPNLK
ncbi:MAG: DUF2213 domain-containing protein [Desulfobulbaceae bacterium]|nr:DUF2213 domain-containing protein [Desulfobulbaceae bacterium]